MKIVGSLNDGGRGAKEDYTRNSTHIDGYHRPQGIVRKLIVGHIPVDAVGVGYLG